MTPTGDEAGWATNEHGEKVPAMRVQPKTQPQALLEEIIPKDLSRDENEKYPSDPEPLNDAPKFPTIQEQQKYWDDKEKAAEPTPPRKWSAKRRKAYNAMKKTMPLPGSWSHVPTPPQEEPVAMIKHCPFCGKNVERFLA